MTTSTISTEERIKQAAAEIFTSHGLDGARMQDIADKAKINKAMLHYYFRTKQQLFDVIFEDKVKEVFGAFSEWFDEDKTFEERLSGFVEKEISIISQFPALPVFILLEARKNPRLIADKLGQMPVQQLLNAFKEMIVKEQKAGNLRDIPPEEILINTMSLCVYPIIAKPMLQFILGHSDTEFDALIEKRKQSVADWVITQTINSSAS